MTTVWVLVFLCVVQTVCGSNSSQLRTFNSEAECQKEGLRILRSSAGMDSKIVYCPYGVK